MILSIRSRLTLLIASVFLVVLTLAAVTAFLGLYLGLRHEAGQEAKRELAALEGRLEGEFADLLSNRDPAAAHRVAAVKALLAHRYRGTPFVAVVMIEQANRRTVFADGGVPNLLLHLPDALPAGGSGVATVAGHTYRTASARHPWGVLTVGRSEPAFDAIVAQMGRILLWVGPLVLATALGLGNLLARRLMRPVIETAAAAERLSLNRLDTTLPAYPGRDEFGLLVATLNRMIERIRDSVARVRRFTEDAAHEMRSPLTVQRGELEQLYQREDLPGDARDAVRRTLDRAIAMNGTVDDLMLLARSDGGDYPIRTSPVALHQLVEEAGEDAVILAGDRPIAVTVSTKPVTVMGDGALLRRLLNNLIDNALAHTGAGTLRLELTTGIGGIRLRIADTGSGIPSDDLPHLFDRFYRAHHSSGTPAGRRGTGLGLAICRWIVRAHGGEIGIDSTPGEGTTVTVLFPADAATTPSE